MLLRNGGYEYWIWKSGLFFRKPSIFQCIIPQKLATYPFLAARKQEFEKQKCFLIVIVVTIHPDIALVSVQNLEYPKKGTQSPKILVINLQNHQDISFPPSKILIQSHFPCRAVTSRAPKATAENQPAPSSTASPVASAAPPVSRDGGIHLLIKWVENKGFSGEMNRFRSS